MNLCSRRIIGAIGALALICSGVTATAAETATSRIVSAANTFLSTFDDKQRQGVLLSHLTTRSSAQTGPTSL